MKLRIFLAVLVLMFIFCIPKTVAANIMVSSLVITPADPVVVGGTLQMSVSVLPSNATNQTVTWFIVNGTGKANINFSNGLLTAVSPGIVNVIALANDGSKIHSIKQVTITPAAGTVFYNQSQLRSIGLVLSPTMVAGTSQQPIATDQNKAAIPLSIINCNSSNFDVIQINPDCTIHAVGTGQATVTAKALGARAGGVTSNAVTITVYPSSLTISPATFSLGAGVSNQLTANDQDGNTISSVNSTSISGNITLVTVAANLTWTSSNPSVATVSASGVVTGVSSGTATIIATVTGSTASGSATVTVNASSTPSGFKIISQLNPFIMIVGQKYKLTAAALDQNGNQIVNNSKNATTWNWSSSNNNIAKVDNTGLVTAIGWGVANITVSSADGTIKSNPAMAVTVKNLSALTFNSPGICSTTNTGINNLTMFLTSPDLAKYSLIPAASYFANDLADVPYTFVSSLYKNPILSFDATNSILYAGNTAGQTSIAISAGGISTNNIPVTVMAYYVAPQFRCSGLNLMKSDECGYTTLYQKCSTSCSNGVCK